MSRGPKPYTQHQLSTTFLRVPTREWAAVLYGGKREFRAQSGKASQLWNVEPPIPIVAYRVDSFGRYDSALMVLEDVWREPLGAISEESLAAEGFESFAEFRRAWCIREKRRFRPLHHTMVYRVRLWEDEDRERMAEEVLSRLYGDFLPSESAPSSG